MTDAGYFKRGMWIDTREPVPPSLPTFVSKAIHLYGIWVEESALAPPGKAIVMGKLIYVSKPHFQKGAWIEPLKLFQSVFDEARGGE